jgi:hypothetical protein
MRGRRPNYAWVDLSVRERKARLMAKVKKRPDGCWEWTGKRFKNGYGCMHVNLIPRRTTCKLAHRVSFELFTGTTLGKSLALHKCDRPWCVRPSHLFRGSYRSNANDMISKGRQNWALGERSGRAKMTAAKVMRIRSEHAEGRTQRALATQFQISPKQISIIVNRKQWRHLP